MRMSVAEAAMAVGGKWETDVVFSSVCTDSRKLKPGCLFVAVEGENFDGHAFIRAAEEQGAAAVLCHKRVKSGLPVILVKNTQTALLRLAAYYRGKFDIPVVGLTGSVGKTTTKDMTACVLASRYHTLKTQGNFNNEIGLPLTVFQMDEQTQAAVLEMGMSNFGEISRLSQAAAPTLGIITKIGVSHMETLGSQEGILKAKLELLDGLKPGAPLLLNGDDPFLKDIAYANRPVLFFGMENQACDFRAEDIEQGEDSTRFVLCYKGKRYPVTLPTIGLHNVYDALAAFGAGVTLGVPPAAAAKALSQYLPSGMRQRVVRCEGLTVIEDCYNASPDSVKAALTALGEMPCKGRRVAVLGDMLELGGISEEAHLSCGMQAAKSADLLFTFGPLASGYAKGARKAGMQAVWEFDGGAGKGPLIDALLEALQDGDAVLFKASRGMKLEEAIAPLYERWKKQC